MRGYVPTPEAVVDGMVEDLFCGRPPRPSDQVLDPGCGEGEFIAGILRWCSRNGRAVPHIRGVELDPNLSSLARERFASCPQVSIVKGDFLRISTREFDFVIGNPPYVSILGLSEQEKSDYRRRFKTARGRFDLYILFFENALRCLRPGGRLVFITPEKFLYVATATPLRKMLGSRKVESVVLAPENTFAGLVTYPTITSVVNSPNDGAATVRPRGGAPKRVRLPEDGRPWLPILNGSRPDAGEAKLEDLVERVSCGVATGADDVYVISDAQVPADLREYALPCIAGRELGPETTHPHGDNVLLLPYDASGKPLAENRLGRLGAYLARPENKSRLEGRTCTTRKRWYEFHDSVPMRELRAPKIICKDITERPRFWIDRKGEFVPRHSVYYIVPKNAADLDVLADYLNSALVARWLEEHCQRATNGYLRLQSATLKQIPMSPAVLARLSNTRSTMKRPRPRLAVLEASF